MQLKTNEMELDEELLQSIPGVGKDASASILAEIGNNMDQFPNEQHLASCAGTSPGNNENAGKKSSRITHGDKYLKILLVQCFIFQLFKTEDKIINFIHQVQKGKNFLFSILT